LDLDGFRLGVASTHPHIRRKSMRYLFPTNTSFNCSYQDVAPSMKDLTGGMGQAAVKPAPESVDTLPNLAALALGSKALRGFRESRERNAGFSFVKDVDGTRTFV
jgi:hypothetical protein